LIVRPPFGFLRLSIKVGLFLFHFADHLSR
jgi:hypothetical protein